MNKTVFRTAAICAPVLVLFLLCSLDASASSWVVKDPFDSKVFIENKGQFTDPTNGRTTIAFGTHTGGATWLFGRHGFYIVRYMPRENEEEKEFFERKPNPTPEELERYEEEERELVPVYEEFLWLNGNPAVQLVGEDSTAGYYCYPDPANKEIPKTLRAVGFRKLKFLGIYPGIDAEFYFPADSSGIKYSLILHPGADLSEVQFVYSQASKCQLLPSGDITIGSPVGTITEHAPIAYSKDGSERIPCSFKYNKSQHCFGFTCSKQDNFIIDPWVAVPNFGGVNKAYDIDYDDAGNVYVMGGQNTPFSVRKYNSSGSFLWAYTLPVSNNYTGDFALDRSTGILFITEGFAGSTPTKIYKVNPAGTAITQYNGSSQMHEMWRIAYNTCTHQGVVVGGGVFNNYQACNLDTSLTNIIPMNVLNVPDPLHDIGSLAIDNYGYCYFLVNESAFGTVTPHDNNIVKMDLPGLSTIVYSVPSGSRFIEASSVIYNGSVGLNGIGYNMLCVTNQTLFSWDGYLLRKWDALTGSVQQSRIINTALDSTLHYWGGIASDACLNVYIGDNDSIAMYDSTLTRIAAIAAPDEIYDVMLDASGNLYASGKGFLMVEQVPTSTCPVGSAPFSVSLGGNFCDSLVTANVVVTGGSPPYNVSWSTTPPQFGDTAYNLTPGNYTVTVSDTSSCGFFSSTTPFTVQAGSFPQLEFSIMDPCNGLSNGSIVAKSTGGDSTHVYTYTWNTTPVQAGLSLQGLPAGTYTLTVSDSGCSESFPIVLTAIGDSVAGPGSTNVFTPNGDGFNDVFYPVPFPGNSGNATSGYHLAIFNRWGMKLFETSNAGMGWDGMVSGNTAYSNGVYYYVLEYQSPCYSGGATIKRAGFVHLLGD